MPQQAIACWLVLEFASLTGPSMAIRIYGNRSLKTLAGEATRPTAGRVREALFNIWQVNLLDSEWLDLCAGSGAIGAEALCRGARAVVGIEQSRRACSIIRQNWAQVCQPSQAFDVICGDVLQRLSGLQNRQFDYIYLDPPYASDLYEPVLEAIAHSQLLKPDGEIAAEHDRDRTLKPPQQLEAHRQKHYSQTNLTFYRWKSE